jgi:pyruvate dehydrogenase E1 component beta subunit
MMAGQAHAGVTIRSIINRGGEQGAQHSQVLHSWFTHIPGLRVVMPYSVSDARDLLIASVLSGDPVIYIDDRWLYSNEELLQPIVELDLKSQGPRVIKEGTEITLVAAGFSTQLALEASEKLKIQNISAEVIDVRVLSPLSPTVILNSVRKTGRVIAIDGGWGPSGFSSEIIAVVTENINPTLLKSSPKRVTLPFAPAPAAPNLEKIYYPTSDDVVRSAVTAIKR